MLIVDQLDLLLAVGGDQISGIEVAEGLLGLREVFQVYTFALVHTNAK